jgi:hypothetical protein
MTELERLRHFARKMLAAGHDWQRREADIALHGWPKETGGAQTPVVAERMQRDWAGDPHGE